MNSDTTKPRRWFRFRLRTLLVMVTVLSFGLGWVGWELDQRRTGKSWVEEKGGRVIFDSSSLMNDERSLWEETKDIWFGEKVREVSLNDTQVSDLSPLAKLKNLGGLYLSNTEASDLSPLADLKNLESLNLDDTQVSDLSPLAELKNLKWLYLNATKVNDLSPLANLKNLAFLRLDGTQVNEEQVEVLKLALPKCEIYHSPVLQNDD